MFAALEPAGRPLLQAFGDMILYAGQPVLGVIDKNAELQDPYQAGGKKLQAGQTMGYVDMADVPLAVQDDLVEYEGQRWKVKAPRDSGMGLWEFTLTEVFDA
jgi:hypothetical protein